MVSHYQPDMFADKYPDAPGWKARDTAQAAAAAIEPKASRLKRAVVRALTTLGPLTADDCADYLGEDKLSIRPRFSELAATGQIEDTGQRGVNSSGRSAIIWRLIASGA